MSTFSDKIKAEIASHQAQITILEAHLATGEAWLKVEADTIWEKVKAWFSHPASTATLPVAPPAPPVPTK